MIQGGVKQASFRFYAELNDFLPPEKRQVEFICAFQDRQSVKHLMEALGVPHTEVDLILINGRSASFSELIQDGDRISVYPVFECFDIGRISRVREQPLRQTRFVADAHLGRLAAYLRMLGFDTRYHNDLGDEGLAAVSSSERRILLTRDRGLLKRSAVTHGYWVRQTAPRAQLVEVLRRFDLRANVRPFTRCMLCNGLLAEIPREEAEDRVPHRSRQFSDQFRQCRDCRQVYWNGSHFRRMERLIREVIAELSDKGGE
jgi:hypothetical protein